MGALIYTFWIKVHLYFIDNSFIFGRIVVYSRLINLMLPEDSPISSLPLLHLVRASIDSSCVRPPTVTPIDWLFWLQYAALSALGSTLSHAFVPAFGCREVSGWRHQGLFWCLEMGILLRLIRAKQLLSNSLLSISTRDLAFALSFRRGSNSLMVLSLAWKHISHFPSHLASCLKCVR